MPIDPSIALGFRGVEAPNALAQYAQVQQIQSAQQANQLNQMKMAEYERARQEEEGIRNYLAGNPNPTAPATRAGLIKFGKTGLEYGKLLNDADKSQAELGKVKAEAAAKQTELFRGQLANVKTPEQAAQWVQAQYADPILSPVVSQVPMAQAIAGIPTDPKQFENWKNQNALGMSKWVERNTMTAFETGKLEVDRAQLKVAQDRLAKDGAALDPAENAAISKAIIEGRLDPNRVNGRNAKILATTLLANPEANVLELGVSAAGATASERSLATQTAKMSTAANEANKMVDVVRNLSDKIDRTEFPTINAISNAVSKGTGGKEIVQLNTSINALVNSYARAISPTGQPTVSDKNHAREIINSAYSNGQIGAILDVMQQEMAIARDAAGTASADLKASREAARGRATAPKPSSTGVDTSNPLLR